MRWCAASPFASTRLNRRLNLAARLGLTGQPRRALLIRIIIAMALAAAWCGSAAAQSIGDARPPTAQKCAAVYGAFAQDQGNFGTSDSLLGERYFNYAKINFDDRLGLLAGKAEKGISQLKDESETDRAAMYMQLVDAETEGDVEAQSVRDLIRLSDTCDAEYGFSPSMGS